MLALNPTCESLSALERAKNLLPESMLEIIDVIGFESSLKLVKALGGRAFPVGKGINKKSSYLKILQDAIGEEATKALCKVYGGQVELYIPNCHTALLHIRNEQFRSDVENAIKSGESKRFAVLKLSGSYGFSDRHAWNILKNATPKVEKIF